MAESNKTGGALKSVLSELPFDKLKDDVRAGVSTLSERAVGAAGDRLSGLTDKLNDVADGGGVVGKAAKKATKESAKGGSPVKGALVGGLGGVKDKVKNTLGGGGNGGKGTKATNIIEEIDVGVPVSVAYNQWTQFQDYSKFMKKVDNVDQEEDTKVNFKAQVFWSHRRWEATILEQVPNEKIVWRSKGEKGHVDGTVTFHELAPNLTRILVVLEYYPQGFFEKTGNLWRAQGRRARLELKHFRRHVMTEVILDPDEVEGWRGEIHDGEVERSHDEVVEEEENQDSGDESEDAPDDYEAEDEYDEAEGGPEDEYEDEAEEPEAEEPEDEYDEADEAEEVPEDEYEEEDEYDDTAPEDEYDEPEDEELEDEEPEAEDRSPRRRRKAS